MSLTCAHVACHILEKAIWLSHNDLNFRFIHNSLVQLLQYQFMSSKPLELMNKNIQHLQLYFVTLCYVVLLMFNLMFAKFLGSLLPFPNLNSD